MAKLNTFFVYQLKISIFVFYNFKYNNKDKLCFVVKHELHWSLIHIITFYPRSFIIICPHKEICFDKYLNLKKLNTKPQTAAYSTYFWEPSLKRDFNSSVYRHRVSMGTILSKVCQMFISDIYQKAIIWQRWNMFMRSLVLFVFLY